MRYLSGVWWGPWVFVAVYAMGALAAVPGLVFVLTGGAVWGTFLGTVYNTLGANLGANLAFLLARLLGRDFVGGLLRNGRLQTLDEKAGRSGFQTVFTLRLIPLVPFNIFNYAAGFSKIRHRDYALGSLLGMLPATFVYTYFADALLSGVEGAGRKAYLQLGSAVALLIALSLAPKAFQKWVRRPPSG